MRVKIYTETRALLWFAMSNGVAHFYFTLLPYLTHEDTQVSAMLTSLSVGLACLWLYAVRTISPRLLILWIPCGWLYTYSLIVDGHAQRGGIEMDNVIDLTIHDILTLSETISVYETVGACFVFGFYLFCNLRWLNLSRSRPNEESSLSPYQGLKHELSPAPKPWPSILLIYWVISAPLSVHFWSTFSPLPKPLDSSDVGLWVQALWLISALPIVIGVSLVLFRLRPVNRELSICLKQIEPMRAWRRKAWLYALLGAALIFIDLLMH